MNKNYALVFFAITSFSHQVLSQCNGLFFSEYVEGGPGVMALEIYNPTTATIDLGPYYIRSFPDGSSVTANFLQLNGSIASGAAIVVQHDQLVAAGIPFDGNDAMSLEKITSTPPSDSIFDVFGEPGVDPGTGWTADALANYTSSGNAVAWTRDHTLRRKATVQHGLTSTPSPFNVTLEWDSLPMNTISGLGTHTCNCQSTGVKEGSPDHVHGLAIVVMRGAQLEVRSAEPLHALTIFDQAGRVVRTFDPIAAGMVTELLLPGADAGLYILRGTTQDGRMISDRFVLP